MDIVSPLPEAMRLELDFTTADRWVLQQQNKRQKKNNTEQ
jgi:hypothetical protein